MSDPVAMKGVAGRNYQPADSSCIYIADPSTGAISNRDTGTSGVLPEHVHRMMLSGCVLAAQTAFAT